MKSIYLINPRADFPTYYGAEVYAGRGYAPAVFLADLVVPTLAALVPSDWHVAVCDEHLEPVDYDLDVDFVGITGKVSQWGHMMRIAREFSRRGKVVVMGGPHATLSPGVVRPHCDVLVKGEIEGIAQQFFGDLDAGCYRDEYEGGRPELDVTPIPRWDLCGRYHDRILTATVQTARGCPFECEFCDVIQYLGRRQRKKPISAILAELEVIYGFGYRSVLFADDNTTASRGWVKEMLEAVATWNARRTDGRVSFSTQLSVDAARDDDLLDLCSRAGMTHVFIGIETVNDRSLEEARKHQNREKNLRNSQKAQASLVDQVQRFMSFGIGVTGGMICGFDHDGPDTFERQYEFAMESAIPVLTVGALVAPAATPLHARLEAAGRLAAGPEVPAYAWDTNIVPLGLTSDELRQGLRWLVNKLYHGESMGERLECYVHLLQASSRDRNESRGGPLRSVDRDTLDLLGRIPLLDPETKRMWDRLKTLLAQSPTARLPVLEALIRFQQLRYMFEEAGFWDGRAPTRGPFEAAGAR